MSIGRCLSQSERWWPDLNSAKLWYNRFRVSDRDDGVEDGDDFLVH